MFGEGASGPAGNVPSTSRWSSSNATRSIQHRSPRCASVLPSSNGVWPRSAHVTDRGRRRSGFNSTDRCRSASRRPRRRATSWLDLARHAWRSWRYFSGVDERANLPSRAFDSRVYLVVRPPADADRNAVEGQSEQGGRIGSVEVEIDEAMVDLRVVRGDPRALSHARSFGQVRRAGACGDAGGPRGAGSRAALPAGCRGSDGAQRRARPEQRAAAEHARRAPGWSDHRARDRMDGCSAVTLSAAGAGCLLTREPPHGCKFERSAARRSLRARTRPAPSQRPWGP